MKNFKFLLEGLKKSAKKKQKFSPISPLEYFVQLGIRFYEDQSFNKFVYLKTGKTLGELPIEQQKNLLLEFYKGALS